MNLQLSGLPDNITDISVKRNKAAARRDPSLNLHYPFVRQNVLLGCIFREDFLNVFLEFRIGKIGALFFSQVFEMIAGALLLR
jgi:hypothetical protein